VLLNVGFIAVGSWVPFDFHVFSLSEGMDRFYVRFAESLANTPSKDDVAINTVITIPLAFLVFSYLEALCPCSLFWRVANCVQCIIYILILSILVEFSQVWFEGRVPSYHDVKYQFFGAIVGLGVALFFSRRFIGWLCKSFELRKTTSRIEWALDGYLLGLFLYSVLPFDLITSVGELWDKYLDKGIEIAPAVGGTDALPSIMLRVFSGSVRYVPVGLLFSIKRNHSGGRMSLAEAFMFGAVMPCGIEFAQLFLRGRIASVFDVLIGSFGVTLGLIIGRWFQCEHVPNVSDDSQVIVTRQRFVVPEIFLAAVLYCVFLVLIFWYPYNFIYDGNLLRRRLGFVINHPFDSVFAGNTLRAFFAGIHKMVLFLPLGLLLGILLCRVARGAIWTLIWMLCIFLFMALFSSVVEILQVLLPGRSVGVADVLQCFLGALVGLCFAFFIFRKRIGISERTP
jgi:VanZ family protein